MQLLEPLSIVNIRLTSRDILHVSGIDEQDFQTPLFEYLEDWNPVVGLPRFHGQFCVWIHTL